MRRLIMILLVCAAFSSGARALEIKGVKAFGTKQLNQLQANSASAADLIKSLWESYVAQGYFDVQLSLETNPDSSLSVTEGHQYALGELRYKGVADSMVQASLSSVGSDTKATESGLEHLLEAIVNIYADGGFPYATATIDSLFLAASPPGVYISVNTGPQVAIAKVSYEGLRVTRPSTLDNYIDIRPGDEYTEAAVQQSYENLRRLDFVRATSPPDVVFQPRDKDVTVIFPLREERNFAFDGLAYLTPDNEIAGNVNTTLSNIFGYGEKFHFSWQRANRTSARLTLASEVRRIFSTPVDAGVQLQQNDRDSSFVSTSARLSLSYHLSSDWNVSAGFGWSKVTPEEQRLTNAARVLVVDLRTIYDSRDEKTHTHRGLFVQYSFQSAYRREFPASGGVISGYSRRLEGNGVVYQPLSRNLVWRQRVWAFQAASDFQPLPLDELIEVGGPESIRGYRDNSFFARLGAVANSELRWLALENFTLLAFCDNGVIKTPDANLGLTGFGAGFLIDSSVGEFRFEAALGEKKSLDQMLVHFGFSGEL